MQINLDLLPHQAKLLENDAREVCLVGGYGAGKTRALADKLIVLAHQNYGMEGIALSPTYQMASKVLIPEIQARLDEYGFKEGKDYKFNKSYLTFEIGTGSRMTRLHILAAETYKRAAGINAAFFGVDEADLINVDLAEQAWRMLMSRLRRGRVYQGCAVSTPEGFNFLYKHFEEEVNDAKRKIAHPSFASLPDKDKENIKAVASRVLIRASTYDNPFLPADYIANLESSYPPELIGAYLRGEFTNLSGSPVYFRFKPDLNATTKTIADFPHHYLHLGIDFNKNINATTVSVFSDQYVYVIDEIMGCKDVDAVIAEVRKRYPTKVVFWYPDASGFEGIQTLRRNFGDKQVLARAANPRVEHRVTSLHDKICSDKGVRTLFINPSTAPTTFKCVYQQVKDRDGAPDKAGGLDHNNDALGYSVHWNFPSQGRPSIRVA